MECCLPTACRQQTIKEGEVNPKAISVQLHQYFYGYGQGKETALEEYTGFNLGLFMAILHPEWAQAYYLIMNSDIAFPRLEDVVDSILGAVPLTSD